MYKTFWGKTLPMDLVLANDIKSTEAFEELDHPCDSEGSRFFKKDDIVARKSATATLDYHKFMDLSGYNVTLLNRILRGKKTFLIREEYVIIDEYLTSSEKSLLLLGQPGIGACVLYLLKWSFSDIGVRKIVVSDLLSSEKTYSWERHHLLTYVNAALRVSTSKSLSY